MDVNAVTSYSVSLHRQLRNPLLFKRLRPLDLALPICGVSIMQLLLDAGAEAEGTNAQGSTTLIDACRYGYLECVQLLVEYGANLYNRGIDRKTCLHVALEKRNYSIVKYLLRQESREGVARPTDGLCLLRHLILTDDAASISNLKHCGVDLNASCPVRSQPLLEVSMFFVGWNYARFLCDKAVQEQSIERTVASWSRPKHPN